MWRKWGVLNNIGLGQWFLGDDTKTENKKKDKQNCIYSKVSV